MSGVRTISDIKDRCTVDDITGCWHWRGARNGQHAPSLWFPPMRACTGLPTVIAYILTGKAPPKGVVWHCTCETRFCANPAHRKAGNRSTQMLARKLRKTPLERARIARSKRANSKLTDDTVREIRESDDILRVIAERYGCSADHVWKIKHGTIRRPLAAPGASVFSWMPA